MDAILKSLQGKAFHLSDEAFNFISEKYADFIARPIPELDNQNFHPSIVKEVIKYHREQFQTEEYAESRIQNPTTGTIDHLHAEVTASIATGIGESKNYRGYAIELLRLAAHFHDSDRSFPGEMVQGEEEVRNDPEAYKEYKKYHSINSVRQAVSQIRRAESKGYHVPEGFIRDISHLILNHEWGGEKTDGVNLSKPSEIDQELNLNLLTDIITDADSLAYFYANILTNWEECGKDKRLLSNKIHFMYDRMSQMAQEELRKTIIFSDKHILGKAGSKNSDINNIREVLLKVCTG